jgi:membrane-associated phospholipid phosphatase
LLILALSVSAVAQESHPNLWKTIVDDGRDAGTATWTTVRAPLHASADEYLVAAGLLGGVALSSTLDRTLRSDARRQTGGWVHTVDDIGHTYQGPWVIFGTGAVLYGYGVFADHPAVRRTAEEIVEAFAISGAGTQLVKYAVGRDRPFTGHGPFHFVGPSLPDEHHSFPSGDVTVAFSFSSVLAAEAQSWQAATVLYALAGMTAFQRMNLDKHWFSDTLGGAMWGTAVGWGVVHINRKLKIGSARVSLTAMPRGAGVHVAL